MRKLTFLTCLKLRIAIAELTEIIKSSGDLSLILANKITIDKKYPLARTEKNIAWFLYFVRNSESKYIYKYAKSLEAVNKNFT